MSVFEGAIVASCTVQNRSSKVLESFQTIDDVTVTLTSAPTIIVSM